MNALNQTQTQHILPDRAIASWTRKDTHSSVYKTFQHSASRKSTGLWQSVCALSSKCSPLLLLPVQPSLPCRLARLTVLSRKSNFGSMCTLSSNGCQLLFLQVQCIPVGRCVSPQSMHSSICQLQKGTLPQHCGRLGCQSITPGHYLLDHCCLICRMEQ